MVGEHGIQTFEVEVVMLFFLLLLFDVFVPRSAHSSLFVDKWFDQIYLKISLFTTYFLTILMKFYSLHLYELLHSTLVLYNTSTDLKP